MKSTISIFVLAFMLGHTAAAESGARAVLQATKPEYPAVLKQMHIGGKVKLSVVVAADGTVKETNIAGGNPVLAESASAAVKKWKFAPAPQATTEAVEITFNPIR